MKKYYNELKQVGTLVSCSYGLGWSSYLGFTKKDRDYLLFNYDLVQAKINKKSYSEIKHLLEPYEEEVYSIKTLWEREVEVVWVDKDRPFYINTYDGYETIVYQDRVNWYTA